MKTRWIVGGLLLVVLLLLTLRERFTTYEQALQDVGQTSGQVEPTCPSGMTLNRSASVISKTCEKTTSTGSVQNDAAQCSIGYALTKRGTNWACVPSSFSRVIAASGSPSTPVSSATTTTTASGANEVERVCPSGYTPNGGEDDGYCRLIAGQAGVSASTPIAVPSTCPAGYSVNRSSSGKMMCTKDDTNLSNMLASMGIGSGPPGSAGVGTSTATDTGGTSGMAFGPTNQSKMVGQKVWGPASKGLGQASEGPVAGDSSKSTPYPVLLGGETGKSSTRIEGVGVVPPSFSGLSSTLPSSKALGTEDNARFLPYSREPGDQELIPDPYRLAKNFSSSSYSMSKTDPVPFLTDFSAFYK